VRVLVPVVVVVASRVLAGYWALVASWAACLAMATTA
jgi:hypothetical protein